MSYNGKLFSLDGVQRKALLNLHVLEKDVSRFRRVAHEELQHFIGMDTLRDIMQDFISMLLMKVGMKTFSTIKDCATALNYGRDHKNVVSRMEFNVLQGICDRDTAYLDFVENSKKVLFNVYNNYMNRFCHSFFSEAEGIDLFSINEYESIIYEAREEFERIITEIDSILTNYQKARSPFTNYLRNYGNFWDTISRTCKLINEAGEPIKRWVFADKAYPHRMELELATSLTTKQEITEEFKRAETDWKISERRLLRLKTEKAFTETSLQEARAKLYCSEQRRGLIKYQMENGQKYLKSRKRSINVTLAKLEAGKTSDKIVGELETKYENLTSEIDQIEAKMNRHKCEFKQICIEIDKNMTIVENLEDELDKFEVDERRLLICQEREIKKLQQLKRNMREINQAIKALKKIRDVKLNPATVINIKANGFNAGSVYESRDKLEEVFRMVSSMIGQKWEGLYKKLPFEPPRDTQARGMDIEDIGTMNQNLETRPQDMALRSLHRWQQFSRTASVDKLVSTLRRMKCGHISKKVLNSVLN